MPEQRSVRLLNPKTQVGTPFPPRTPSPPVGVTQTPVGPTPNDDVDPTETTAVRTVAPRAAEPRAAEPRGRAPRGPARSR